MRCSEAKRALRGIPWPTFHESTSTASRRVVNPHARVPDQVNKLFSNLLEGCFSRLSVQCPAGGSLPRTVSLVVSEP